MLERAKVVYSVGNKNNPGDPWGRTELTIEIDGSARLDQDSLGGLFAWTGRVVPSALDRFWSALEEAGFPEFPMLMPPAGSATRYLTVGDGPSAREIFLPYHAPVRGYSDAFFLLDSVIRQLSQDRLKVVPESSERLVDEPSASSTSP